VIPHTVPDGWTMVLSGLWDASPHMCREVWGAYCAVYPTQAATMSYQLGLIPEAVWTDVPSAAWWERCRRALELLTPQDILTATLALSPEGRGRRRRDVVQLEEAILDRVGPTGQWT
jgi:hypothetical protein